MELHQDTQFCFASGRDESNCIFQTRYWVIILVINGIKASIVLSLLSSTILDKLRTSAKRRFWGFLTLFALALLADAPNQVFALVQVFLGFEESDKIRWVPAVTALITRLDSPAKVGAQVSRCLGGLRSVMGKKTRLLLLVFMGFVWAMLLVRPVVGFLKDMYPEAPVESLGEAQPFLADFEFASYTALECVAVIADFLLLYHLLHVRRCLSEGYEALPWSLLLHICLQTVLDLFLGSFLILMNNFYGPSGFLWGIIGPLAQLAMVFMLYLIMMVNENVANYFVKGKGDSRSTGSSYTKATRPITSRASGAFSGGEDWPSNWAPLAPPPPGASPPRDSLLLTPLPPKVS